MEQSQGNMVGHMLVLLSCLLQNCKYASMYAASTVDVQGVQSCTQHSDGLLCCIAKTESQKNCAAGITASCSMKTLRACMLLCSAQLGHGALLWPGVQAALCCHLSPHCFQIHKLINHSKYMQPRMECLTSSLPMRPQLLLFDLV